MNLTCHPRVEKTGAGRSPRRKYPTCFDLKTLEKIQRKSGGDGSHKTPEAQWSYIQEQMRSQCAADETCVVKEAAKKVATDPEDYFRPFAPKEWRRTKPWLSTSQIAAVMNQQEDTHPDFLFVGPTPIDWYLKEGSRCLVSELCSLRFTALRRQYRWLGVIFNLDPHTEPGSHWVAAMIDLRKPAFYQQDSYGYPPEREIRELQLKFGQQMQKAMRAKQNLYWNSKRHQFKNTECGLQSIIFLERMLQGHAFKKICDTMPRDDEVVAMRAKQFNF